jgi:phospholipase C
MNRIAALGISVAVILSLILSGMHTTVKAVSTAVSTTRTPIKHLVVIFQENISFDHYFGTYPTATNPTGEPKFIADRNTPSINGLADSLLHNNPNIVNPFRLDRSRAVTCNMNNGYTAEQKAYHGGLVDKFVESTGSSDPGCNPKQVMGYYDGNTVTALFSLSLSLSSFRRLRIPSGIITNAFFDGFKLFITHCKNNPSIPSELML